MDRQDDYVTALVREFPSLVERFGDEPDLIDRLVGNGRL